MSQEKKAAQPVQFTEEEEQQAIADIDLIFSDPDIAKKFTQKLLALGRLEDKPSQERLSRVHSKFFDKFQVIFKTSGNNRAAFVTQIGDVLLSMLRALYINPIVHYKTHTEVLRHFFIHYHHKQIEPSVQGCLEDCFKLFSKYCDLETNTLLQQTIKSNSVGIIKFLLDKGFNLFAKHGNVEINTLLQQAIELSSLEAVKLFVERGADIWKVMDSKKSQRMKESPLYLAMRNADHALFQWLLEEGASIAPLAASLLSPDYSLESWQAREGDKGGNWYIARNYIAREYTPEMVGIENNIEELRRSVEKASEMKEALIIELLPVNDVVNIVSSYILWDGDKTVDDKAVEKKDTVPPTPGKRVLYIQWARQKLRELAELIPAKTSQVIPAIEAVKNEVLKVLTSSFLQAQCETFWDCLKTARKEDKPLSGVSPPGTTSTVAENKSTPQVSLVGNTATFNFSSSEGSHKLQGAPTNDTHQHRRFEKAAVLAKDSS